MLVLLLKSSSLFKTILSLLTLDLLSFKYSILTFRSIILLQLFL